VVGRSKEFQISRLALDLSFMSHKYQVNQLFSLPIFCLALQERSAAECSIYFLRRLLIQQGARLSRLAYLTQNRSVSQ
jgi:hypothetical protein